MTPAARLQAAIQILDTLASGNMPADAALKAWGRASRYAGSADRRAVAENVYAALRTGGAGTGRQRMAASLAAEGLSVEAIAAMFEGGRFGPAPLSQAELAGLEGPDAGALGLPDFIEDELRATFGHEWREEAQALLRGRASLDVRVNTAKVTVAQARAGLPPAAPTPLSAVGLRFEGAPDLLTLPAFEAGQFEVQDEGSQIAAFLAGSGALVVDYCAGGGGKTLALAANSSPSSRPERSAGPGPRGSSAAPSPLGPGSALQAVRDDGARRLIACDVDQRRLDAIRPRLRRAGVDAELRELGANGEGVEDLAGQADLVLVDAPCSASGTWRRRPEAAWRLDAEALARLNALQTTVLERAAALVKPGGRLAYVTCSVLDTENGAVARAFAQSHPQFRPLAIDAAAATPNLTDAARQRLAALSRGGHTVQLSPRRTATDGFFIALFERSL